MEGKEGFAGFASSKLEDRQAWTHTCFNFTRVRSRNEMRWI